jgi:uncharacterized damage-inducible protein DinB
MEESAALAEKLREEGNKLADFLSGLDEHQWKVEVYAEGITWTVRGILAHLMTAERSFIPLFGRIRHGGPGVAEDFSIDRYNARQQEETRELAPPALLAAYRSTRDEMIALVQGFNSEELEKRGRHPFLGVTTLREMVKLVYIHNQTHYRDIRRALKRVQSS